MSLTESILLNTGIIFWIIVLATGFAHVIISIIDFSVNTFARLFLKFNQVNKFRIWYFEQKNKRTNK